MTRRHMGSLRFAFRWSLNHRNAQKLQHLPGLIDHASCQSRSHCRFGISPGEITSSESLSVFGIITFFYAAPARNFRSLQRWRFAIEYKDEFQTVVGDQPGRAIEET